MSEKEPVLTEFGVEKRPWRVYHTCTFQDLGLRKDEFLEKVVHAMEAKGFKKAPPIEPFRLSLGRRDVFRPPWSWLRDMERWHMAGSNVFLTSESKGVHLRMGLRAEARGKGLRFGYFYGKRTDVKSARGILFILGLVAWFTFIALTMWFMLNTFSGTLGILGCSFLSFAVCFPPALAFIIYYEIIKPKRILNEIERCVTEIAESLGGKQLTPFKLTTLKLED